MKTSLIWWWWVSFDVYVLCVCLSGACGGLLLIGNSPGFLFSPGWPENYPPNQECTWLIRAPDSIVEFNFLSLDMEGYPPCYSDNLIIRDGKHWKMC